MIKTAAFVTPRARSSIAALDELPSVELTAKGLL